MLAFTLIRFHTVGSRSAGASYAPWLSEPTLAPAVLFAIVIPLQVE